MFSTPIVLIVFNRPDFTKKLIDTIAAVKPKHLLVVADGPRADRPQDKGDCEATRQLIDSIDWEWEHKIEKNYADANMGCGHRPASGIGWALGIVDRAIVLEDDCVPNLSFFRFCEEMLERYENHEEVMLIAGTNNLQEPAKTSHSYYFSKYPSIWGWATWRRAWANFDITVANWDKRRETQWLENKLGEAFLSRYFRGVFEDAFQKKGHTGIWDYQWTFNIWDNNGLCIFPKYNLVSNIGWGPGGTHTLSENDPLANRPTRELDWPLDHPDSIECLPKLERNYVKEVYGSRLLPKKKTLIRKIRNKINRMLNR